MTGSCSSQKTRTICPECGKRPIVNKDNGMRSHGDPTRAPHLPYSEPCLASGAIPEEWAAEMVERGRRPHADYLLAEEAGNLYTAVGEGDDGNGAA